MFTKRASILLGATTLGVFAGVAGAIAAMVIPPPTQDPSKVPSGAYRLNTEHSQVIFRVMHLRISPYYGRISKPTGMLKLDAAHPEKSTLSVDIEMGTLSTTVAVLDDEVRGPKWFNVAQFPKATFQSTAVHLTGPKTADVTGNLTFHGVTKPVTLHATFTGAMQMPWANNAWEIGFSVLGSIKQTDFGFGPDKVTGLSDNVDLLIAGEFGQNQ